VILIRNEGIALQRKEILIGNIRIRWSVLIGYRLNLKDLQISILLVGYLIGENDD